MKENSNSTLILSQRNPWENNENSIWLASTLKMYRNLSKYNFPNTLTPERRKQVTSILNKSLSASSSLKKPSFVKAEDVGPLEKEFLFEHFLAVDSFHQAHADEAFIFDESGEFLAIINVKDHLQIQLTDCKGELESSWNRLIKIETELGTSVDFSFSSRFGFLTSDPVYCGTGLSAYVYLHVPALIHSSRLSETLEKNLEEGVAGSGMQGNPTEFIGDILALHNVYALGVTEETIIGSLRKVATKMMLEEKSLRTQLHATNDPIIKDKISKAFGLLLHSYQLNTQEAWNGLSLLKLGVDLGWISGISQRDLNKVFFSCRRAHLMQLQNKSISNEEVPRKRAEFIHEALKTTTLVV